ncbi:30S ribosomal protein S5 [Caldivirga maquilingensis]|uniref:Small ribosomal subunit protein uS5 n=1 Tax=Caldivirga maquilingensis (strain ATCC 700844 / DSM 13496 / JCM 10307 / IC-167) TaxID=397948 RepID=A8MCN7_CALMQ|nr:30S ribosomal protein S5 [Caldivirga maquilingensis]ABW01543.1 ribosomal protein S5 [Caldivirga maquilingensis IC-167]
MSEVPAANIEEWKPRTEIGRLVKEGKIKSIDDIFIANARIQEPEIVDALLTNLKYEVLSINIVQRQTDAGEVSQFQVAVALGNEDGYVGIGVGKARQIGPAMEKAIREAKVNIIPVRRGCGSWYCSCDEPHSVPFVVRGRSGSVFVELIPAPKGVGLVAGDTIKPILRLAGIKDVWSRALGETRTTLNFAMATWNALKNTYIFKI